MIQHYTCSVAIVHDTAVCVLEPSQQLDFGIMHQHLYCVSWFVLDQVLEHIAHLANFAKGWGELSNAKHAE